MGTGTPGNPATFTGFTGSALANVALNQGSADLDVELTAKDRIPTAITWYKRTFARNPRREERWPRTFPGLAIRASGFRQLMTVSEDHTFGPTLTNTVRLGFNRIHLILYAERIAGPFGSFGITEPAGGFLPWAPGCRSSTFPATQRLAGRPPSRKGGVTLP